MWDSMKKEYVQWLDLKMAAMGLGWDHHLGTIRANLSWWKLHLVKHPEHAKYGTSGPANLLEMEVMFDNARITGENATISEEKSDEGDLIMNRLVDDDEAAGEDDDCNIVVSSLKKQIKSVKRKSTDVACVEKEDKNPFLHEYKKTLSKINTSAEESSCHIPNHTPSVKDVLEMMVECGVVEGTTLYYTATMLAIKVERELFSLIQTKEGRLDWLNRAHAERNN